MEKQKKENNPHNICLANPESECINCTLPELLICRFDRGALVRFFISFMTFGIPAILGIILGGYGWFLVGWFVFWVIFFEFWEIRILCSHCPFYAEEGKTLRCIANYGSYKAWKYHPEPMNKSEKAQLLIGFAFLGGYPIFFLILGMQWIFLVLALIGLAFFFIRLLITTCPKCVNFSCPLNRVPKNVVDAYLKKNTVMREAWEKKGYKID